MAGWEGVRMPLRQSAIGIDNFITTGWPKFSLTEPGGTIFGVSAFPRFGVSFVLWARPNRVGVRNSAEGVHAGGDVAEADVHTEHVVGDLPIGIPRLTGQ